MSEAERIEYLIKTLESGNATEFARKIGAGKHVVTRMRKGTTGIRLRINDIIAAYPAISRDWLETGKGYPGDLTIDLVKAHYETKLKRAEAVIDNLLKQVDQLKSLQNACKEN